MKVLVAGEGPTELGELDRPTAHRAPTPRRGLVEFLARRVAPGDWAVGDAIAWKNIRHFKAGAHRSRESRLVLGLALRAQEGGCEAIVFSRDSDGERERVDDVERGIEDAGALFPALRIAGGCAQPCAEAWVLALLGERRTESLRDPKAALHARRGSKHGDLEELLDAAGLRSIPDDARSLRTWLGGVRAALAPKP